MGSEQFKYVLISYQNQQVGVKKKYFDRLRDPWDFPALVFSSVKGGRKSLEDEAPWAELWAVPLHPMEPGICPLGEQWRPNILPHQ